MKLRRTSTLALALSAFAVVAASCSKETKGPAAQTQASEQQKLGASGDANAVPRLPTVEVAQDQLARQIKDGDNWLKGLVDEEAKARAAADDALANRIKALEERVTKLEADLKAEVARLDAKDAELAAALRDHAAANDAEFAAMRQKMESEFAAQRAAIEATRRAIRDQIIQAANEQKALLQQELARISQAMTTATGQTLTDLQAQKARIELAIQMCEAAANGDLQRLLERLDQRAALGDAELKAAITTEVNTSLAGIREDLNAVKRYLESELAKATDAVRADVQKQLDDVKALIAKPDAELKITVLALLNTNLSMLRTYFGEAVVGLRQEIITAVGDAKAYLAERMAAADDEARAKIQAEVSQKFNALSADIGKLREYADANFATKAELQAVNVVIGNMQNVMGVLGKKIEDTDARISSEVAAAKNQLRSEIALVQADVDSVRNALGAHIQQYKETILKMQMDAAQELIETRSLIAKMQTNNAIELQALNTKLNGLTSKVAEVEFYAQNVRSDLEGKVAELQARDAELAADVRTARDEAKNQLLEAIKSEQTARMALQQQVNDLAAEMERVAAVAKAALAQSKANEEAIAGLRKSLDEAKAQFGAQLDALRNEMENKIEAVRAYAEGIVKELGSQVSKQFAETAASLAELRAKDAAAADDIARFIANAVKDASIVEGFKTTSKPQQESLLIAMGNIGSAFANIEGEFLNAIGFVHADKGVDNKALNESFRPIAALPSCGGITGLEPGFDGRNASVNDEEWYFHLARAYSQMLISGTRSGASEFDRIFFGQSPLADGKSLVSAILLEAIPSRAAGAGAECVTKVNDWARATLLADTAAGRALRTALTNSTALRTTVGTMLRSRYQALLTPAANYEKVIADVVRPKLGSDSAVTDFFQKTPAPGMWALIAQLMGERARNQYLIAANSANLNSMLDIARGVATIKNTTVDLQRQIDELNRRIDALSTVTPEQVAKLTDSVKVSFSLIAGIATRLGYADIVELARIESGKLGGTLDRKLLFPVECSASSHFFNYAYEGQPLKRCDSGVDVGKGVIGDNGRCRSVQRSHTTVNTNVHTTTVQTNVNHWRYDAVKWVNQRCWGETCSHWRTDWAFLGTQALFQRIQSVSQSASTQNWMQHSFVGDLRAPIISPLLPEGKMLLARAEGSPFPADRKTMFGLRLFGNAWKWRITNMDKQSIELVADDFKVKDAQAGNVYEIPASMFLARDDGFAGYTEFARVVALDARGVPTGKQCLHSMNGGTKSTVDQNVTYSNSYVFAGTYNQYYYNYQTHYYYSPIVLDLTGKGRVATVSPRSSNAMFDMAGTGRLDKVGWIDSSAGFLVMDLNGNGKIDDGRELFGNHTRLPDGREALNGYEALAQYDSDGNGSVDAKDMSFAKLRVWIDANGNGSTEKGELHSLASLGITSVGTQASDVPLNEQMQHASEPAHNLMLYQGTFTAKFCPKTGCRSYDVYFGTDRSVGVASAK